MLHKAHKMKPSLSYPFSTKFNIYIKNTYQWDSFLFK